MSFRPSATRGLSLAGLAGLAGLAIVVACSKPVQPPPPAEVLGGRAVAEHSLAAPTERLSAAVITIAHAGVDHYAGSRPKPTRTKAEALALATELAATVKKEPARFRELAMNRSEDPFALEGGELHAWTKGESPGPDGLDGVVGPLAVGAISEPVDTEYGYRIFVRLQTLAGERISARHIVVAWAGATRAPRAITRTKAEALGRARELAARARREAGTVDALIQTESDGWDKTRGGFLGHWVADGGRYPVSFDRTIAALAEGAVSEPIESEFGYQIFQRLAPSPETVSLSGAHILIAFRGAAHSTAQRSKADAEKEAARISSEARKSPERFGQLAVAYSDDPSKQAGGDLGVWKKGAMPAAIDDKLASLKMGEVSDPVLTSFGYHVLLRREAPTDKPYVVK